MDDLENLIEVYTTHKFSSDEIFAHLLFLKKLLEKYKIKYWLMYGSLLGCIRENDIIKHDYDFDVGINYEDTEKVYELNNEKEVVDNNYSFVKGKGMVISTNNIKISEYLWRVSLKFCYKNVEVGDLYIYKEYEDGFMRRFDPELNTYYWPNATFPSFLIKSLSEGKLRDHIFSIPNYSIYLIEHWYGPHWKIPIVSSSQNGTNHQDYDYYGNYKYSSLKELINKMNSDQDIMKQTNCKLNYPSYFRNLVVGANNFSDEDKVEKVEKENKISEFKKSEIKKIDYIFPLDHFSWLINEEGIVLDKKLKSKLKKKNIL